MNPTNKTNFTRRRRGHKKLEK